MSSLIQMQIIRQTGENTDWLACAAMLLRHNCKGSTKVKKLINCIEDYRDNKDAGDFYRQLAELTGLNEDELRKYEKGDLRGVKAVVKNLIDGDDCFKCKLKPVDEDFTVNKAIERIKKHIEKNEPVAIRVDAFFESDKRTVGAYVAYGFDDVSGRDAFIVKDPNPETKIRLMPIELIRSGKCSLTHIYYMAKED